MTSRIHDTDANSQILAPRWRPPASGHLLPPSRLPHVNYAVIGVDPRLGVDGSDLPDDLERLGWAPAVGLLAVGAVQPRRAGRICIQLGTISRSRL